MKAILLTLFIFGVFAEFFVTPQIYQPYNEERKKIHNSVPIRYVPILKKFRNNYHTGFEQQQAPPQPAPAPAAPAPSSPAAPPAAPPAQPQPTQPYPHYPPAYPPPYGGGYSYEMDYEPPEYRGYPPPAMPPMPGMPGAGPPGAPAAGCPPAGAPRGPPQDVTFLGPAGAKFFDDMNLDDSLGQDYESWRSGYYRTHPCSIPSSVTGQGMPPPPSRYPPARRLYKSNSQLSSYKKTILFY